MWLLYLTSALFTAFSSIIMSYIAMATPIGPWIAPTILIMAYTLCSHYYIGTALERTVIYITITASVGGIIATAVSFTLPTLYFLDPDLFAQWFENPVIFIAFCGSIIAVASCYGALITNSIEHLFIDDENKAFPISHMLYRTITAQQEARASFQLLCGAVATICFNIAKNIFCVTLSAAPLIVTLCPALNFSFVQFPAIQCTVWPMLWAIGFVTGEYIIMPLIVGMCTKIIITAPMQQLLFPSIDYTEFTLAFCSGIAITSALTAFSYNNVRSMYHRSTTTTSDVVADIIINIYKMVTYHTIIIVLIIILFFSYFQFSILTQWYLLIATFIAVYQIVSIATDIGLAQLGRFATFVLVPALLICKLNAVQATIVAMFVEISSGVAVDLMFGRKLVALAGLEIGHARKYQYIGIAVSVIVVAATCWILINQFHLGSATLFAQRSQARALLLNAQQFNVTLLAIGMMFGYILKRLRLNPMLVLGGLLMPVHLSLGLIVGGCINVLTPHAEQYVPFCSGVFTADSLWIMIQSLL